MDTHIVTTSIIHLLLVEDNDGDAVLLQRVLPKDRVAITHTTRLRQGLETLNEKRFDVVLLDLSLPDSDGLETLTRVQELNTQTPVIILTGRDDDETAIQAIQHGAQDYIVKGKMGGDMILRLLRYAIERKRAEMELVESELKFRTLFENAIDGILIADAQTRKFLLGNNAIRKMLGYAPEELSAIGVDDIHPAEHLQYVLDQFNRQSRDEIDVAESLPVQRKDGTVFYADISASPVTLGRQVYMMGIFRDVTERKQTEEKLQRSMEQISRGQRTLQAINSAAQAAQRAHSPQAIYQAAGAEIKKMGFDLVVLDFDADKRELSAVFYTYAQGVVRAAEKLAGATAGSYRFPVIADGYYQRVLTAGKPVLYTDIVNIIAEALPPLLRPLTRSLGKTLGAGQGIYAALQVDSKPKGIMVVMGNELGEDDIPAVEALSSQISIALENAELYQDALDAAERRDALYRNSQLMVRLGQDVEQIYAAAHHAAAQLMPAEIFTIVLLNEERGELEGVYLMDKGGRSPARRIPMDKGFSSNVIRSGEAFLIQDLEQTPLEAIHFGTKESARSLVAVPMREGDKVFGAISAQSYQANMYREEDRALLEMLAAQVAVAIQNVRHYEQAQREIVERKRAEMETQQRNIDLLLLGRVNQAINRGENLSTVVALVSDGIRELFDNHGTTIYLLDAAHQRLVNQNMVLPPDLLEKLEKLIGIALPQVELDLQRDHPFRLVFETKKIQVLNDPREVGEHYVAFAEAVPLNAVTRAAAKKAMPLVQQWVGAQAEMLVPLVSNGELIGVMDLSSRVPFTEDDIQRMESIAAQLTIAIRRKQDEESLRESEDRYRDLVENSQDLICTHDLEGRILSFNPFAAKLLSYSVEALQQMNIRDILVPGARQEFDIYLAILRRRGKARGVMHVQTKNGEERIWEYNNTVRTEGVATPVVRGMAHDITERARAEKNLAASESELRALFNAMHDVVLVYDKEGRYLKIAPTRPDLLIAPPADLLGKTVHEVLPQAQADLFVEKIHTVLASQQPLDFEYCLPINDQKVWFGVTISPLEADAVIWVAHNITNHKQHQRELEAITAVSAALRTAATRAEMLPVILDQLSNLLAADTIAFAMRDIVTGETVMESARGKFVGALRARLPGGEGVSGQVIDSGKPYLNNDFQSETRFARSDIMGDTTAAACVPMIAGTEIIGAIWIGRTTPITDSDIHLLTAIAEIAASAIHRSTLHEEAKKQLERLAALRAIDVVIGSSFDLRLTLNTFLNQVLSQLHVDAASVLSHHAATHTLDYVAGIGFHTRGLEKTHLRLGEGHAGRAALERRMIYIPDLIREPLAREKYLAGEKFVSYHAVPLIVKGEVKGLLEVFHRAPFTPDASWLDFLETLAGQAAIAMDNAALFENLQRRNAELILAYDSTIEGWSHALDLRDKETEGHTQRVTEMTMRLVVAMGIADNDLLSIRRGALLHDIGKMGVPDSILLKPGPLDDAEWVIMRQHPQYAYEMLSSIPFLKDSLDIPYCHHEKWDGTGYPRGLKGEQIPLAARIFAIVDVWDALRSDRPYRQAWTEEKVREHIQSLSGTHFDPNVVEAFLRLMK